MRLKLAVITKIIAAPTGKYLACPVQIANPPPAVAAILPCRADKPRPFPAIMAGRPFKRDTLLYRLIVATVIQRNLMAGIAGVPNIAARLPGITPMNRRITAGS